MFRTCLLVLGLIASLSEVCRAQGDSPFRAHPEGSLAPQLVLGVAGDRCIGGGDVVGCSRLLVWAFEVAARERVDPSWSIGGLASIGGSRSSAVRIL